jgi:uncharacterized protein
MTSRSIAVIGSGISGLSAAWLLSRSSTVTLYEKQARPGGHSNTVEADVPEGRVPVDTGFIVFNRLNYPNLTAMFDRLGVETAPTEMSFAVSVDRGRMEYGGQNLNSLFGQRRNIIRVEHWRLVADILRFFREAEKQALLVDDETTMEDFLVRFGYSSAFVEDHLLPISAAIWSTPARRMLDFPARSFVAFFANHHLLQIIDRPQWLTVRGGAKQYVGKLLHNAGLSPVTEAGIAAVERHADGADLVFADGSRRRFDEVVFACHADQALALLADPSEEERQLLGAFQYNVNEAVLHTDKSFMPRRRGLWSSWNYLRTGEPGKEQLSLSYWMNRLQPLKTKTGLFVTLNPGHDFAPGSVQYRTTYEHPLFDNTAIAAQRAFHRIQGVNRTWFAGAWLGYGFHEDGIQSGLEVAERIGGIDRPWTVSGARDRIAHNWSGEEQVIWAAE